MKIITVPKLPINTVLHQSSVNEGFLTFTLSGFYCSVAQSCQTLWSCGLQHSRLSCPSLLPRACSDSCIGLVMLYNHLALCCPVLLLSSIFPSIRVFSNELAFCIRWPKYWSFSFNISPSKEHSGLISFRLDWFDLLAIQGTLKSLLQHDNSKARESYMYYAVSSNI